GGGGAGRGGGGGRGGPWSGAGSRRGSRGRPPPGGARPAGGRGRRCGASAPSPPRAARRARPATPPAFRSCARSCGHRLSVRVLVVTAPPRPGVVRVLVAAERGDVEEPEGGHQPLNAARIGRVRVVDDAVLQRERAQPLA